MLPTRLSTPGPTVPRHPAGHAVPRPRRLRRRDPHAAHARVGGRTAPRDSGAARARFSLLTSGCNCRPSRAALSGGPPSPLLPALGTATLPALRCLLHASDG